MDKNRPLSFLNHHLKCGNSLLGAWIDNLGEPPEFDRNGKLKKRDRSHTLNLFEVRLREKIPLMIRDIYGIMKKETLTPDDIQFKKTLDRTVENIKEPFRNLADLWVGLHFGERADDYHNLLLSIDQARERISLHAVSRRVFHWELEFPEVFFDEHGRYLDSKGFDCVIGNPPYIRQEGLGEDKAFFEVAHHLVYSGVADLYVYFYHLGLTLCRKHGRLGMITSNKFLRAGYGKPLRQFLAQHQIIDLIDFRDLPIFEGAAAYPLILLAQKSKAASSHLIRAYSVPTIEAAEEIKVVMREQIPRLKIAALSSEGWTLERPEVITLVEKIRSLGKPLGEIIGGKFYRGVLTGFNEAFVIDEARRKELIAADEKSDEIIKPFLRGRDIKRWHVDWAGLYLIFTRRGIDIDEFPAIKSHLLPMKKRLMPGTPGGRKPGTYKWFEIQDSIDYFSEFEKPTIRYQVIASFQQFAFTSDPFLSNDKTWIIPTDDLSLLAILNSNICWWFLDKVAAKLEGGAFELRSTYVEQIPIPVLEKEQRNLLSQAAKEIIHQLKSNKSIKELEQKINEAIYQLYGLTKDEVKIIEQMII